MTESEKVDKMFTDLYVGDGKENPSLTTRVDRLEQILVTLSTWKWLLIACILTMIGDIVSSHIK